jgi:hypothetical protein
VGGQQGGAACRADWWERMTDLRTPTGWCAVMLAGVGIPTVVRVHGTVGVQQWGECLRGGSGL